jgi:hypothetical protein
MSDDFVKSSTLICPKRREDARDHVGPKTNADPAGSGKHLGWPFSRHIYRSNRMHAGYPSLGLTYMSAGGEIDIIPAQIHQLAGSKLVAVGRPASMLNVCLANCDHDHVLPLRRMACDPAMGETLGVPIVGVGEL